MSIVREIVRYVFCPRGLAMLAVIIAASLVAANFPVHHAAGATTDPGAVFMQLFGHLAPVPLSLHPHADPAVPLALHAPWLPSLFTQSASMMHGEDGWLVFTNLQVFQLAAVLFILIGFAGVPSYLRSGKGDAISKMFAGFARFIRDDMVFAIMGKEHGAHFLPYFLCVFFFVLFQNLFGLIPHGATATASIAVTGAMAVTTFGAIIGCGMAAQGPLAFWKNLVPHVPAALWPLMFVVELIGLCVKPFALMIRLFANMTAGHLIVLSCMGLIMFFAKQISPLAGYGSAPLAIGFAVFIMIIETFVAVLQAYIFTTLSIIFVGASVHPEH